MWRCCLVSLGALWLTASPASAYTAYVSNEKGNTVTVIDTDKMAVTATIKVGQRPRGIEFTRDGKFVMVAVGDDDTIQLIDTKTQQIVDTLPSGPDPELFTQDESGKTLYVANISKSNTANFGGSAAWATAQLDSSTMTTSGALMIVTWISLGCATTQSRLAS